MREDSVRGLFFAVLLGLVITAVAIQCVGCAGTQAQSIDYALDAVADTIDPAYSLAMDVCAAQERAILAARRSGLSEADADKSIAAIRPRCDKARQLFDSIRLAHELAVQALQKGEASEAERLLEQVRALWRELGKGDA